VRGMGLCCLSLGRGFLIPVWYTSTAAVVAVQGRGHDITSLAASQHTAVPRGMYETTQLGNGYGTPAIQPPLSDIHAHHKLGQSKVRHGHVKDCTAHCCSIVQTLYVLHAVHDQLWWSFIT
jgi:hypothetical protein